MTAVYFQKCHFLEARQHKNSCNSWATYFSCVFGCMLFYQRFYLSKPSELQAAHILIKLFSSETDPQTLTQVLGLLTYRFTVPSISPTNKNKKQGLLLIRDSELETL